MDFYTFVLLLVYFSLIFFHWFWYLHHNQLCFEHLWRFSVIQLMINIERKSHLVFKNVLKTSSVLTDWSGVPAI